MSDEPRAIQAVRPSPICPRCARDLEARVEMRVNGKVSIALTCARHGSFPQGWRSKFLDETQAATWAVRQRQLKQRTR